MDAIRRIRRTLKRRAAEHGTSGQALAEIAIALPLLLLMLIGIWEFARAYQIQQVVVNAAREGAREVVLPQQTDEDTGDTMGHRADAVAVVQNYLSGGSISTATATITIACAGANCPGGATSEGENGDAMSVTVTVPYTFNLIGPIIELVTGNDGGPGTITLSSTATMRHE